MRYFGHGNVSTYTEHYGHFSTLILKLSSTNGFEFIALTLWALRLGNRLIYYRMNTWRRFHKSCGYNYNYWKSSVKDQFIKKKQPLREIISQSSIDFLLI